LAFEKRRYTKASFEQGITLWMLWLILWTLGSWFASVMPFNGVCAITVGGLGTAAAMAAAAAVCSLCSCHCVI
jgi:hypothetical protein